MAPPSPRRSSRARPTNPQSQHSSTSSGSSSRGDRNTRSVVKPSSGKSTPSASLSSEPPEDNEDTLLGRRRTRGQNDEQDKIIVTRPDILDMANGSDDLQDEEDEAVRCICGSDEYPGRPPVDSPDTDIFAAIELTEDVTGFFVQCDVCKVWQHGACVGIFSAESSPDEYFCELCRKELHKIHTATNGQRYSKYLPLYRPSRGTSRAASLVKDGARSPKNSGSKSSRQNSASQSSKRRSTMNSRDAAYDDEQLRRAIEASREETIQDSIESVTRRTKRGRSDSEENILHVKRQRTSSRSASPPTALEQNEPPSREESEDEASTRNGLKKLRNGRNPREKSEKEDRERQRQEAASKRKNPAERRRAEDSDMSEEVPVVGSKPPRNKSVEPPSISEPPTPVLPPPGTPPAAQPIVGSSHKRGGRSNHKKGKGKNQYTKDLDKDESPARSMSRDIQKNTDEPVVTAPSKTSASETKQVTKAKSAMATKMSMADMKRRVAAIMDFISRTQVDLAAEASPPSQNGEINGGQASPQKAASTPVNGSTIGSGAGATPNGISADSPDDKEFKELNCMEMMDVLTRDMVKWQNQYV